MRGWILLLPYTTVPIVAAIMCYTDNACSFNSKSFSCNVTAVVNCSTAQGCISFYSLQTNTGEWSQNFRGCASDDVISSVFDKATAWSPRCGFGGNQTDLAIKTTTPTTPVPVTSTPSTTVTTTTQATTTTPPSTTTPDPFLALMNSTVEMENTTTRATTIAFNVPGMKLVEDGAIEFDDDDNFGGGDAGGSSAMRAPRDVEGQARKNIALDYAGCICYHDYCNVNAFMDEIEHYIKTRRPSSGREAIHRYPPIDEDRGGN